MTDKKEPDKNGSSSQPEPEKKLPAKIKQESEKKKDSPSKKTETQKKSTKTQSTMIERIPWVAMLAIVVAIGAIALGYNNHQQQATQLANTQQRMLENQQDFQSRLDVVQSTLGEYKSEISSLNKKLADGQASAQVERGDLEHKIKQVTDQASIQGRDPLAWRIAEVEYLMAVANHRLILSSDINTAATALMDADKRLRAIADPGLTLIRRAIADELKALQSAELPDINGMAHQLSALIHGIEQLPLVNRDLSDRMINREKTAEVDSWTDIPAAIYGQIKGLVSIRHNNQPIEPLLPPDEQHYLSQNLGLKLEQARLALLRKDTQLFRSNLKDTGLWVGRYFDQDSNAVHNVINTINELLLVKLDPEMPDISQSLRELRQWMENQKNALYQPSHGKNRDLALNQFSK